MKGLKRAKRVKGKPCPRKDLTPHAVTCECGEKFSVPEYVEGVECSTCLMKGLKV